jgi:hypothetical protein
MDGVSPPTLVTTLDTYENFEFFLLKKKIIF